MGTSGNRDVVARTLCRLVPLFGLLCSALVWACSDSGGDGDGDASDPSSSSASASGVGGGGAGPYPVGAGGFNNPEDATTGAECKFEGTGGANGYECDAVTIALSQAVPLTGLTVKIETELDDTFTNDSVCASGDPSPTCEHHMGVGHPAVIQADADPATKLVLRLLGGNWYDPASIDVELTLDGTVIADTAFPSVEYSCHAYSSDDWCWESQPLQLTVTLP
jgi:hypothetical protein